MLVYPASDNYHNLVLFILWLAIEKFYTPAPGLQFDLIMPCKIDHRSPQLRLSKKTLPLVSEQEEYGVTVLKIRMDHAGICGGMRLNGRILPIYDWKS